METSIEVLTGLLNTKCEATGVLIKPKQLVAVLDWGRNNSGNVLGYGWFDWDKDDRGFTLFESNQFNTEMGHANFYGLDDAYDTFAKARYRVLTEDEKNKNINGLFNLEVNKEVKP